jgi:hypothetical protein
MAGGLFTRPARSFPFGADGAPMRQDHDRGLGHAHAALFKPGSLSVVACPAQRQTAEAVRRARDAVHQAGGKLAADNVYGLELSNGARVLALPGSDKFDPRNDRRRLDCGG